MASPNLRRTRIVCISDTHNNTFKLPKGDVLIHAGDLTNQGSFSELSKTIKWLEEAPFEAKVVIAGNHDITLDDKFYADHGLYFHSQKPQSPSECQALLLGSQSITYLRHEAATVRLKSPTGPHTEFNVFGSPYSPRHGMWAFYYDTPQIPTNMATLPYLWKDIPLNTDIVVTHTPSWTHRDETDERRAGGCEALRRALWRVRPKLAVCGHIHAGRGAERVTWDLESRNISFAEKGVARWTDPGEGNKKLSLVDLTGRKEPSLANDGSHLTKSALRAARQDHAVSFSSADAEGPESLSTSIGKGGDPESGRSDSEALLGRMGRRETCIVNAAIMKSRYPHIGGKQFYKPIVVDVDLPVWHE
ncbi:calcineurin-like phosphoesterase domain-containing protein [Sarocladium implicatum]|nr:calcineurin-like phosphoesterase domain-containing protein [Sarocladium implicatum]